MITNNWLSVSCKKLVDQYLWSLRAFYSPDLRFNWGKLLSFGTLAIYDSSFHTFTGMTSSFETVNVCPSLRQGRLATKTPAGPFMKT